MRGETGVEMPFQLSGAIMASHSTGLQWRGPSQFPPPQHQDKVKVNRRLENYSCSSSARHMKGVAEMVFHLLSLGHCQNSPRSIAELLGSLFYSALWEHKLIRALLLMVALTRIGIWKGFVVQLNFHFHEKDNLFLNWNETFSCPTLFISGSSVLFLRGIRQVL